jgi:hypothetical protein
MTVAFYFDDSQHGQAKSPANAVQWLRSNAASDSIANLWGGGNSVNLVWQSPTAGSGALLMMGRTGELADALSYASGVSNIDAIWCSDDSLVVLYVRCHIGGTGALGIAGHTHTVVSVAPLWKYWGLQRNFLTLYQGHNGWFSMYPWNQQDAEIFNSGIYLATIRDRVHHVDPQGAFHGLRFN